LTVDQKVEVVLFNTETKSAVETQRCFHAHFGTRWTPCKQTIYGLCQQFETNGSVLEMKRPRPASVRTPANIEAVHMALIRSTSKSTRRASTELGISRWSLQRILHSDLHIFPYNITIMHKLMAIDKEQRLQFALWAMEEEAVLHNTWLTDEAYLHLYGVVNKQNIQFWVRELPHTLHEKENYGAKVNVWTTISTHGIIGPFFFDTVTKERYKDILENSFIPHLLATGLPIHSGSCRMEPVHTLQTWFLISCMRRLIFV